MENNFQTIKEEILKRAKEADACTDEYKRAYKSEDFADLLKVVTDNFHFCCNNKVIDVPLLEKISAEICNANDLYFNSDCKGGYLLVDNATVRASDNATVEAWGNATVRAWGNATVRAWDNATVRAWGNATVRAWDNATVEAWGNATVEAWGNAYTISYNKIEHKLSGCAITSYYYENRVVLGDGFKTVEHSATKQKEEE